jgi:hypothetical protein
MTVDETVTGELYVSISYSSSFGLSHFKPMKDLSMLLSIRLLLTLLCSTRYVDCTLTAPGSADCTEAGDGTLAAYNTLGPVSSGWPLYQTVVLTPAPSTTPTSGVITPGTTPGEPTQTTSTGGMPAVTGNKGLVLGGAAVALAIMI